MTPPLVVIDTSYLLELFKVPGKSSAPRSGAVRARFDRAVEQRWRLFVPTPVVYELANRIATVEGADRRTLAVRLASAIETSVKSGTPWNLCPAEDGAGLLHLFRGWAGEHVDRRLSLTDSSVLSEARRLKAEQDHLFGGVVHIWTLDHDLKAGEPDREADAYVDD